MNIISPDIKQDLIETHKKTYLSRVPTFERRAGKKWTRLSKHRVSSTDTLIRSNYPWRQCSLILLVSKMNSHDTSPPSARYAQCPCPTHVGDFKDIFRSRRMWNHGVKKKTYLSLRGIVMSAFAISERRERETRLALGRRKTLRISSRQLCNI